MKTLNFTIGKALKERLNNESVRTGASYAEITRRALDRYLKDQETASPGMKAAMDPIRLFDESSHERCVADCEDPGLARLFRDLKEPPMDDTEDCELYQIEPPGPDQGDTWMQFAKVLIAVILTVGPFWGWLVVIQAAADRLARIDAEIDANAAKIGKLEQKFDGIPSHTKERP